jgi:hypothetical protein
MQFALVTDTRMGPALRLIETSRDIPSNRQTAEPAIREQFDRIVAASPNIGPILVLTTGPDATLVAVESPQDYPPREIVWVHFAGLAADDRRVTAWIGAAS